MSNLSKDQLMGLILTTESMNLSEENLDKAAKDWENYYSSNDINFNWMVCHLIFKAETVEELYKVSRGFPEHVRIFVEKRILEKTEAVNE